MDTFDKILDVISHHNKKKKLPNGTFKYLHTPLQTLTRLYRKNQEDESLPALTRTNVHCWEKERPKSTFCAICTEIDTDDPKKTSKVDSGHQIVVLVRNGNEYILDGYKRCRFWYKNRDQGMHTALFIKPL